MRRAKRCARRRAGASAPATGTTVYSSVVIAKLVRVANDPSSRERRPKAMSALAALRTLERPAKRLWIAAHTPPDGRRRRERRRRDPPLRATPHRGLRHDGLAQPDEDGRRRAWPARARASRARAERGRRAARDARVQQPRRAWPGEQEEQVAWRRMRDAADRERQRELRRVSVA